MDRELKFDSQHYEAVTAYLNKRQDLRRIAGFGGDGQIYKNGTKNISGVKLQMSTETNQVIVSELSHYNNFPKIEKDLGKLTKKEEI